MKSRVLCVRLPQWPLQRIQGERPELNGRPILLYCDTGRSGLRVVCCSRAGITPGLPLAEAQALLANADRPCIEPHDPQADRKALEDLAAWCQQFSPLVGIDASEVPDSLLLDVTGVAHLFGGERGLVEELVRSFGDRGYCLATALSDTIGAAWGLAHFGLPAGRGTMIVPPGQQHKALGDLPVEALRLPEQVVQRLQALDLRLIHQLDRLPRASLPSRFGPVLLQRLDQALGRIPEPLIPYHPREVIEAVWPLEHSTADRRILEPLLQKLLDRVLETLAPRREGIQQLWCGLECVPRPGESAGEPVRFPVELVQPRASISYLLQLIGLRLERITLAAEVSCVRLRVTRTGLLECRQRELFENCRDSERSRELRMLLDQLSSRLGAGAVLRPQLCPDHQPEHAVRFAPVLWRPAKKARTARIPALRFSLARPLRLKRQPLAIQVQSVIPDGPPMRLEWDGQRHEIARSWGPERIATGWWRKRDVRRDYYRIETDEGRRFWIFRRIPEGDWFLHGEFA